MLRATTRLRCAVVVDTAASGVNVVTLNREKALNALNQPMVEALLPHYKAWHAAPKAPVLMKGAGAKAFCAGGDIVSIVQNKDTVGKEFFFKEYQLNYLIKTFPHPHVALLNGIVMGGGVGLSVHGSHRVCSEKTLFSMPETAIGLFPDVGGSIFLPRMSTHAGLGTYLALTGHRLKGADAVHAGVGTHFVDSTAMDAVERDIVAGQDVDAVLAAHRKEMPPFSLAPHLSDIAAVFAADSVAQIVERLEAMGSNEWAAKTLKTLRAASPTSVKVTFEQLRRGALLTDPIDNFAMEYCITQRCMATTDFFSGVTAILIDKTGNPQWNPKTLEEVTDEMVQAHFRQPPTPWAKL
jgi:enoyl-CoA hydratase/carnithine racemase